MTKTPNCSQNPTFTFNPSNPSTISFVSNAVGADALSGIISISGATLDNKGTYSFTLTVNVDSANL